MDRIVKQWRVEKKKEKKGPDFSKGWWRRRLIVDMRESIGRLRDIWESPD